MYRKTTSLTKQLRSSIKEGSFSEDRIQFRRQILHSVKCRLQILYSTIRI